MGSRGTVGLPHRHLQGPPSRKRLPTVDAPASARLATSYVLSSPTQNSPSLPRNQKLTGVHITIEQVVGAKAEEVLGERARDLHVPPDHWTEDLLEVHEQFVHDLREMGDRAAPIVEKVKKREELVQVRGK